MPNAHAYTKGLQAMASKKVDWVNDTIKAILLDATYSPSRDVHQYVSDLTGELTGGAYARATVTGKSITVGVGTMTLVSADVSFASMTASPGPRYLAFFVDTGSSATSPLIMYMDFDTPQPIAANNAVITAPPAGWMTFNNS